MGVGDLTSAPRRAMMKGSSASTGPTSGALDADMDLSGIDLPAGKSAPQPGSEGHYDPNELTS